MNKARTDSIITKANNLYKKHEEELNPAKMYKNLVEAIQLYSFVVDTITNDQRISVLRNIGIASWKAAELKEDKASFHFRNSLENLCQSLELGIAAHRPQEWQEILTVKIEELIPLVLRQQKEMPLKEQILLLKRLLSPFPSLSTTVQLQITKMTFNSAILLQEKEEWIKSKSLLVPILRVIDEGLAARAPTGRILFHLRMKDMWTDLLVSVNIHLCRADSTLACLNADKICAKTIGQEEDVINADTMWEVLDMYFQAMLLTREKDIEREAIAASRIGRMYDKIFKMPKKAHDFYRKAHDLGISLQPRNVTLHEWHMECQKFLKDYQQKYFTTDDATNSEWKKPFLDELKDEIEKIQKIATVDALLKYLWENHPPKGDATFPNATTDKRRLFQAIARYHPDKQHTNADTEKKWYVLSEEITKILTVRYAVFKENK